jgi:hypothetical protein
MLFLYALLLGLAWGAIEYSPAGAWEKASDPEKLCKDQYLCAEGYLTWQSSNNPTLFNVDNACDALVDAGIRNIDFHGDSYMRQIYAAVLITLNGNYRNGSIADTDFARSNGAEQCVYHTQFAEKHCGVRSLNHGPHVCDGRITLDPMLNGVDSLTQCGKQGNGSIVLFSWGNYKVGPHGGRHGVNDPAAYSQFFEDSGLCPAVRERDEMLANKRGKKEASAGAGFDEEEASGRKRGRSLKGKPKSDRSSCGMYWISTHYRLVAHFPDEAEHQVKSYNEGMRNFFTSGKCGDINYIDVYNMTAALGQHHKEIAPHLSYDKVHWGMEVNLQKAQIIINALVSEVSVLRR